MLLAKAVVAAMNGWTQERLEEATGIPQSRISAIRRNYRNERVTLDEAHRIERAIGLPLGFILGFAGVITPEGAKRGAEAFAKFESAS